MAKEHGDELEEIKRNTKYLFTRLVMQLRLRENSSKDPAGALALMSMTVQEMRTNPMFALYLQREAVGEKIKAYFDQTRSSQRLAEASIEQKLFNEVVCSIFAFCRDKELIDITDALVLSVNGERTVFLPRPLSVKHRENWNLVEVDLNVRDIKTYAVYKDHTNLAQARFFFSEELARAYHATCVRIEVENAHEKPKDVAGHSLDDLLREINTTAPGSIGSILRVIFPNLH